MNPDSRAALLSRGLTLLTQLHPVTVTIGATDYTASGGPVTRESVVDDGGTILIRRRLVQILLTDLATRPVEGTLTTIDSESWRILSVTSDLPATVWRLTLENPTSR